MSLNGECTLLVQTRDGERVALTELDLEVMEEALLAHPVFAAQPDGIAHQVRGEADRAVELRIAVLVVRRGVVQQLSVQRMGREQQVWLINSFRR